MKKKQIIITVSVIALVGLVVGLMGCNKDDKTGTDKVTPTTVATNSDAVTKVPSSTVTPESVDVPTFEVIENEDGEEEVIINDVTDVVIGKDDTGKEVAIINGTEVQVETKDDGSVVVKDETVSETVKDIVENTEGNKTEIVIDKDDKGNVSVVTPTKKPEPTVTKKAEVTKEVKPTVTKKAEPTVTKKATSTPVPTVTKKAEVTPVPTKTPVPTATKVPTKAPTATPTKKPTATPTPNNTPSKDATFVEFIIETRYIKKGDIVITARSHDGTIVLFEFENDTAPDYPYITSKVTSKVPSITAADIQRALDSGMRMYDIFLTCCSEIGESYSVGVRYKATKDTTENWVIGEKYSDGTIIYYSDKDCFGEWSDKHYLRYKELTGKKLW